MNEQIKDSKQRAMAWSNFLVETLLQLGIADNEVIRNCHVGRGRFYFMKQRYLINVDAYFRIAGYAHQKLHEQVIQQSLTPGYMKEWERQFLKFFFEIYFF